MAKKKCPECPAGEKWAVPYADFLSLLLALFIALYAIGAVDAEKAEALTEEFIKIFDYPNTKSPVERRMQSSQSADQQNQAGGVMTAQDVSDELAVKRNKNNERYNIALDQAENQIAIDLPASVKFGAKSSEINDPDMINFVRIVSMIIFKLPDSVAVEIRGYADENSDHTSNYILGANRAFSVFNMLLGYGVDPKRLRYTSFGDSVKLPNTDMKIAKIYFRVDIKDKKLQRSVLDLVNTIK